MADQTPQPSPDNEPLAPEPADESLEGSPVADTGSDSPDAEVVEPQGIDLPSFDEVEVDDEPPAGIDLLSDVNLNVKIELGRTMMLVEDVLRLKEGGVVELEKLAGDPVDIYVNDRPVARGEVLVLNDNFCVRISEILDTERAGKRPA